MTMNTAEIKPLKKNSESYLINLFYGLLSIVTLGFFAPYVYKKYIANLNVMSRLALGDDVEAVKFSAKFMYGGLILFWGPLVFLSLFSDGVTRPFAVPFTLPASMNVIMPLLGVCLISSLILIWYILKIMGDIKDRLLQIAVKYCRPDVASLYLNDVGLFSSKREKLNQQAYNMLVDEHNSRIYGYESQANQRPYDDEQDEGAEDQNPTDYGGANPFEILGAAESASENEVKNAYRLKCTLWHPDKFRPEQLNDAKFSKMINEEMSKINKAYEDIKRLKGWK